MTDVEMAGEGTKSEDKSGKDADDMTVPFCVPPWMLLFHITRWKDLIGGFFLSTTTTISLGLVAVCYQGVQITEKYDTCPLISIASCAIIVFSNYMLWRSGQKSAVLNKLKEDQEELRKCTKELDGISKLADDTTKLNDTAGYLKSSAKHMTKLQSQMKSNTSEMFNKVIYLKEQRKEIGFSLNAVSNFIEDLLERDDGFRHNLEDLFGQLKKLGNYLKNLQKARNQLSRENDRLGLLKDGLENQLKEFNVVREEIINNDQWANNVFEMGSYLEQRYIQLVELTTNYERNYIMQVVHQCEFIDGKSGWNDAKVEELCERLPENCPAQTKSDFQSAFRKLQAVVPSGVVDFKAMEELVKEHIIPFTDAIVKNHYDIDGSTDDLIPEYTISSSD